MPRSRSIAIIGAGPTGLALALCLLRQGIHCEVYEGRPAQVASRAAYAALSLQPNGLRVLDSMGIYSRIRPRGFSIETVTVKDLTICTSTTEGAGIEDAYGYKRLRIYRSVLLEELQAAVAEQGFVIQYGHRFSHVVSESESGVTFAFADGSEKTADLLIGADGIYSHVREWVAPSVKPTYSGLAGLGAEVPRSVLRFSAEDRYETMPITLKHGKTVVNLVPQDNTGSKIFVGGGKAMEDRSQEEWHALEADKDAMTRFYTEDSKGWPDLVQSALENIDPAKTYLWPVYTMPRLDSWVSKGRRVAILGDAAHAVSPITGQGVNQAFEDAYLLATVFANVPSSISDQEAITFWQDQRMKRVHELVDILMGQGGQKGPVLETKSRVSSATKDADGRVDAWLYRVDMDGVVDSWVKSMS